MINHIDSTIFCDPAVDNVVEINKSTAHVGSAIEAVVEAAQMRTAA